MLGQRLGAGPPGPAAGKEPWLTGMSFTLGAAAATQGTLLKGNLLDPSHGTLARRSRTLSIEEKARSWLMDAGE